ncbi:hypothetical protein ACHAQA_006544 [Verticillium albo-atrum]
MSTKMSWVRAAIALAPLIETTTATVPPIITSAYDEVRKIHATPAPRVRGAARRQAEASVSEFTITVAPDATCGFLSGSSGNAITCDNGNPCSWEPNNINAVFCGVATDAVRLQCLERDAATDTEFCNDVCQSNTFNLLCTETSAPYCRTYAFPDGVRDYRCASTPVSAVQSVDFTYDGQFDRQFETTTLSTEPTTPAGTTEDTTTTASPSPTSLVATSTPTTTPTPGPSTAPAPAKENSTPVGAIVGGAVGGVAVLVLLILGVFFLRRRSSKTDVTPPPDHSGPASPMQQQYQQHHQLGAQLPHQEGYPSPPPQGDASIAGAKSGMVSPVLSAGYAAPGSPTYEGQQPMQQQDVHRMSQPYAPAGPGLQHQHQPPVVYEIGGDGGHHKGQLHEMH